jgi:hypothetical protein
MKDYFFFNVFRKTLIQFLDAFNDIKIARYTPDGQAIEKYVEVPIKLSVKEKVWYWLSQRKDDEMLPMISAWISSIDWASERAVNDKFEICKGANTETGEYQKFLHPIPYNLTVTMNIWTLHMVDIDQIMEQILPFFAPHIFIRVYLKELGIDFDVKVLFRSATPELSHEMGDEEYRVINYTLDFELQTWFFKPVESSKLIGKIFTSMFTEPEQFINYVGDSTSTFTSGASGGTIIDLRGKIEDGDLIVKYNLFEPCDSRSPFAV